MRISHEAPHVRTFARGACWHGWLLLAAAAGWLRCAGWEAGRPGWLRRRPTGHRPQPVLQGRGSWRAGSCCCGPPPRSEWCSGAQRPEQLRRCVPPGLMRPCRPALLLVAAPVLLLLPLPRPAGGADDSDGGGGGGGGGGIAFTNRARQALYRAGQLALKSHQPQFGVYHLAFVLFDATEARAVVDPRSGGAASKHSQTSIGATVAAAAGTDALEISHKLERAAGREVDSEEPPPTTSRPTEELQRRLLLADSIRRDGGDTHVALHHLLLACAQHDGVATILKASGLDIKVLRKTVASLRGGTPIDSADAEDQLDALLRYGAAVPHARGSRAKAAQPPHCWLARTDSPA
jgi:hypothetical protein